MSQFKMPVVPITVALPEDMIEYLRLRKYQERISISKQVRHALETDIFARVGDRANALVAPSVECEVGE